MDAERHDGDGVLGELVVDSGHGVVDPAADGGMSVLPDGEVVGTGGDEGGGWVDVPEVEDVVDGDGEEGGDGGEESAVGVEEVGVGCWGRGCHCCAAGTERRLMSSPL